VTDCSGCPFVHCSHSTSLSRLINNAPGDIAVYLLLLLQLLLPSDRRHMRRRQPDGRRQLGRSFAGLLERQQPAVSSLYFIHDSPLEITRPGAVDYLLNRVETNRCFNRKKLFL